MKGFLNSNSTLIGKITSVISGGNSEGDGSVKEIELYGLYHLTELKIFETDLIYQVSTTSEILQDDYLI